MHNEVGKALPFGTVFSYLSFSKHLSAPVPLGGCSVGRHWRGCGESVGKPRLEWLWRMAVTGAAQAALGTGSVEPKAWGGWLRSSLV